MRHFAIVILGAAMLSACSLGTDEGPGILPTGSGTSRTYAADGFSRIGLSGSDDVDVRVGTAFSVRAEGPSEELDRLRITKHDDRLEIGRKRKGFGWGSHERTKVYVTLPRLTQADIAGSGTMSVDRIEGDGFKANIAGSGDLNVAALAVDRLDVSIAGSGSARAGGTAKQVAVDIAGSGSLDAAGLRAETAKVSVAGSGDVRAAVSGAAQVSLMGSGDVDLGAAAQCKTTKMGSGSVRCGR